MTRDFNSPGAKRWRTAVFKRDKYKCQMVGCAHKTKKLNAHHIKLWSHYPELREVVSNGITLCKDCHQKIWGVEEQYELIFMMMVDRASCDFKANLALELYKKRKQNET